MRKVKEFSEGYNAYLRDICECPYQTGGEASKNQRWWEGWYSAQDHESRGKRMKIRAER